MVHKFLQTSYIIHTHTRINTHHHTHTGCRHVSRESRGVLQRTHIHTHTSTHIKTHTHERMSTCLATVSRRLITHTHINTHTHRRMSTCFTSASRILIRPCFLQKGTYCQENPFQQRHRGHEHILLATYRCFRTRARLQCHNL